MQKYLVTYYEGKIPHEEGKTKNVTRSKVLTAKELADMLDRKNTEDFYCVVTSVEVYKEPTAPIPEIFSSN